MVLQRNDDGPRPFQQFAIAGIRNVRQDRDVGRKGDVGGVPLGAHDRDRNVELAHRLRQRPPVPPRSTRRKDVVSLGSAEAWREDIGVPRDESESLERDRQALRIHLGLSPRRHTHGIDA